MDFSRAKTRVRNTMGWSSTDDVDNTTIAEALNYIHSRKIPEEIDWKALQAWVYIDLVASTAEYNMDTTLKDAAAGNVIGTRIRKIVPPVLLLIDSDNTLEFNYTYDNEGFWEKYPPYANEDENQPEAVLELGRTLFFRPIPDTTYTMKAWAVWRPAEITSDGTSLTSGWEEATIAGTVAKLYEDDEDWDQAQAWWAIYGNRIADIVSMNQANVPGRTKGKW